MRLFVALHPDPGTEAWLAAAQKRIRDELARFERDLRWVDPGSIHLTLVFLGEIADPQPVIAALERCRGGPMELVVGGLGAFPNPLRPAVLWVGVADPLGALERFQAQMETAMAPFVEPERRPFSAHLTLARIPRGGHRLGEAITNLVAASGKSPRRWKVDRFRLMRSELGPSGARHAAVRDFPLRQSAGAR